MYIRLSHILDICLKQLPWVWKICGIGQFEEIIKNFWKISKFKPSSARRKFSRSRAAKIMLPGDSFWPCWPFDMLNEYENGYPNSKMPSFNVLTHFQNDIKHVWPKFLQF